MIRVSSLLLPAYNPALNPAGPAPRMITSYMWSMCVLSFFSYVFLKLLIVWFYLILHDFSCWHTNKLQLKIPILFLYYLLMIYFYDIKIIQKTTAQSGWPYWVIEIHPVLPRLFRGWVFYFLLTYQIYKSQNFYCSFTPPPIYVS